MKKDKILLTLSASVMSLAAASPSDAQTVPPVSDQSTASAPDSDQTIEDIIVTAQKRDERLQDVPLAITAVSGNTLRNSNISSFSDLRIPGVNIQADSSRVGLSVRGVSSAGNPGFDQSVPIYIDSVYFGRGGAAQAGFLDVERIEILRGPQPTFLGKNAIAGALSVITRRPGDKVEANVTAFHEFESNENSIEGGVTIPWGDTFSIRAAGKYRHIDGWVKNTVLNTDGPDSEQDAARISFLWHPDGGFHLYGKYELSDRTTVGSQSQAYNCGVVAPLTPGLIRSSDDDCVLDTQTAISWVPSIWPGTPSDGGAAGAFGRFKLRGGMLEAGYDFGGGYTITSTLAHYTQKQFDRTNTGASSTQYGTIATRDNSEQTSFETRISSPASDRFTWIAGAYADRIKLDFAVPGGLYLAGDPRDSPVTTGVYLNYGSGQIEKSWSLFGELGYKLTDTLTAKVAARYSSINKRLTSDNFTAPLMFYNPVTQQVTISTIPFAPFPSFNLTGERTDRDFQPAVTIEYHPRPGIMLFGSYKEGFKAGGFDLDAFLLNPAGNVSFAPEKVRAYEVGAKMDFWNGRARLNITGFRSDYRDLQVAIFNGIVGFYTANAGTSRSQGVEVEAQFAATRGLILAATVNYLDAKYGSFPGTTCFPGQTVAQGCAGGKQDLSGRVRTYSPTWSGTLSADYKTAVSGSVDFNVGANLFFTSRYAVAAALGPYAFQPAYQSLDAHLGFDLESGKYSVSLVGRNLTDEKVYDGRNVVPGSGNAVFSASLRRTREIAVQVRAKF